MKRCPGPEEPRNIPLYQESDTFGMTCPAPPVKSADTPETLDEAVAILNRGGLVAFPTETVYGLGGDARAPTAIARIFETKTRPRFNPLIVHVPDIDRARAIVAIDPRAERLAKAFWPGPLTLVLPKRGAAEVADLASAGLPSLAVRVPAHPVAQNLLHRFGGPVVAPSANASGRLSPTQATHVAESLPSGIDLILDGGPCGIGVESTIVDLTGETPRLLRPGGIAREALRHLLDVLESPEPVAPAAPNAPGQLSSHYAPILPVRLNAQYADPDEALLAFGPDAPANAGITRNLSPTGNITEAAANLFSMLRELDRADLRGIAVTPIPMTGLGAAINDRLQRAAAPRSD